jgi:hypothetical protein
MGGQDGYGMPMMSPTPVRLTIMPMAIKINAMAEPVKHPTGAPLPPSFFISADLSLSILILLLIKKPLNRSPIHKQTHVPAHEKYKKGDFAVKKIMANSSNVFIFVKNHHRTGRNFLRLFDLNMLAISTQ